MNLLLEGHGLLGFVDGSRKCPAHFDKDLDLEGVEIDAYQGWKMHDRALMQLLIATLSSTAILLFGSYGCSSGWVCLLFIFYLSDFNNWRITSSFLFTFACYKINSCSCIHHH
ncbi:hypothetical protein ACE6H2_023406 [Prunus campanulata]